MNFYSLLLVRVRGEEYITGILLYSIYSGTYIHQNILVSCCLKTDMLAKYKIHSYDFIIL